MKKTMTLASLAAAATLVFGGVALAQDAQPKTSTPGAGCTATGNAMAAGNLGGNATNKDCGNTARTTTMTTTTPAPATAAATTPAPDTSSSSSSMASSSTTTTDTTASTAPARKTRVARADRG